MLLSLSIRDVVLIERLDLSFSAGLSVFTGETGAGKSILLDSLGLALGARAEQGMIRHGASQLTVTAVFAPPPDHQSRNLAREQGLEDCDQDLILRRVVGADGRSRCYLNDHPISVGLLRQLGNHLVEIHGQFESHGLMDPATHSDVLDDHGALAPLKAKVGEAWANWQSAVKARNQAQSMLARARDEEEALRQAFEELDALALQTGEEAQLTERRAMLMQGEKLVEAMNNAMASLTKSGEVESSLRNASRALERVADKAGGRFGPVIAALDRAATEIAEATSDLERISADLPLDPNVLEKVEERLFAIKACARKHQRDGDGLVALHADLKHRLSLLSGSGDDMARLSKNLDQTYKIYGEAAQNLSQARAAAAQKLDLAIATELPPLKLERATFLTRLSTLPESEWGEGGINQVQFMVSTNPGTPPAALGKVASGGELSRFMLALKVILAGQSTIPTMVFDEVDSGIGGAVAAAVGDRLGRLGQGLQVLVVTHSPQVAAQGQGHFRVAKSATQSGTTATDVVALTHEQRREEIARMLAGEIITPEARAAADSLLMKNNK
jgi:DNA repair protein RecN (Recombination protein N)